MIKIWKSQHIILFSTEATVSLTKKLWKTSEENIFCVKVGCAYSSKIVHSEYFIKNPDYYNQKYQTTNGIYEPNCGLDNVQLSYGHDEYLYQVTKAYLPAEALFVIRYHSFYALHRENAYSHLTNEQDREMMKFVHFNLKTRWLI